MSVGNNRHYKISDILGRHFIQTGEAAGLPKSLVHDAIEETADAADAAIGQTESALPADFPDAIHRSVKYAMPDRLRSLRVMQTEA
jgi:serine/threonine-protein kinase HipA